MKERFRKYYRHLELDTRLTKERTKAEVRAIQRCQEVCLFVYAFNIIRLYFTQIR